MTAVKRFMKFVISYGYVKLGTAIICLFFLNSMKLVTIVYSVGLIHSAILSMINSFRKTPIVYIGN